MRGQILVQIGRREDAASIWERATKWWPSVATYWLERAWNCNHLRRFDEAVSCFDAALKVEPANREVALRKASVLDRAGKHEQALAILQAELSDRRFLDEIREKGEKEFDYLISRESSPDFIELLKSAFRTKGAGA